MGLMDMLKTSDPMGKFYAAAEKSNIPQGGVTGAAFKAMFPHGLGNQLFGKEPEPMPPLETPEGTALMADLASNMMVPGTFIGPKGLARLFGDDAAKGMLATAESKLAQGVPKEAVFQELGVFKGPEGKWRYEIDDSGAKLTGQGQENFENGWPITRRKDLIDHEELSKAYPDSAETRFTAWDEDGAAYHEPTDEVFMPRSVFHPVAGLDDAEAMSVALHELQHSIQGRENFARGGGPSDFSPDPFEMLDPELEGVIRSIFREMRDKNIRSGMSEMQAEYQVNPADVYMEAYRRLAGEAESTAVQDRMELNMSQRRNLFPEYATRNNLIIRGLMSGAD